MMGDVIAGTALQLHRPGSQHLHVNLYIYTVRCKRTTAHTAASSDSDDRLMLNVSESSYEAEGSVYVVSVRSLGIRCVNMGDNTVM